MSQEQQQSLQQLIRRLTTAAATASLYNAQHPQVEFLCRQALEHFSAALAEREEISLLRIDQELIYEQQPLPMDLATNRLLQAMQERGIEHLKFRRGLPLDEMRLLVELLTKRGLQGQSLCSSEHIRFGQLEVKTGGGRGIPLEGELPEESLAPLSDLANQELARLQELYEDTRSGKRLNLHGLNQIVGSFIQSFAADTDPLLALAPLRNLDEYSYTHSTNVCILNIAQARTLGISGQLLYDIGIAAMLHDVGKLFVPEEVLQKPGKLDPREWEMIQAHPRLGAEYLVSLPGIPRLAVITAYEHHMRYDQAGYPTVGKHWQQHLCSQLTSISDFFDALRTHRSYRIGMDFDKIAMIMEEEAGTALHPQLVRNFLKTLKQLDQGEQSPRPS